MKEALLAHLKENNDQYVSGEELSKKFGVSRAAVWKAIKQLRSEGYKVDAKTKIGYKLIGVPDSLNPYEIKANLNTKRLAKRIHYFEELGSTNDYAKELSKGGFGDGDIVVAEKQTKGHGRFSRQWQSPSGKGVYVSIMLKPEIPVDNITQMTLLTALATCDALEQVTGKRMEIKWPNDIMADGKKVCGILTEMSGQLDAVYCVIVGIGINVNFDKSDFGEALADKATSLKIISSKTYDRIDVVRSLLSTLDEYYDDYLKQDSFQRFLNKYKEKTSIIDKNIAIKVLKESPIEVKVLDILQNGALRVITKDGEIREYLSGEITMSV